MGAENSPVTRANQGPGELQRIRLFFMGGTRTNRMKHLLRISIASIILILAAGASAHVGSPDVFLEGKAGPYRLFVTVRVPQVIPGVAQFEIRSESDDVREIRTAPMQLTGPGSEFAPTPDLAQRSKSDPQFFTGSLWLMEFGSLQIRIQANGARGSGELAVPVPAVAQRTLPMQRPLGILLFLLMLLLGAGLISISAAAVREGSLDAGAAASPANVRRARIAMATATLVVAALLFVGGEWWNSDASRYARNIYSPPEIVAALDPAGRLVLREKPTRMAAGNPRRAANVIDFDNLIPDHGHLMHLFMIRTPGMDSFWHLHPERTEPGFFAEDLPAMPPGHYKLFADVVLSSGFPVTMVGNLDVPSVAPRALTGDDSGVVGDDISGGARRGADLYSFPDGGRMIWERDPAPLKPGIPEMFHFRVEDSRGTPARDLEPYMGMAAHAEIVRSDGSVFAHVHPSGSVSMAAWEMAQAGLPAGQPMSGPAGMPMMEMPAEAVDPEISFPYGFPRPGRYRMFVQVKRSGRIETGVFDATVE
jgi:hypothetical protein